MTVWPSPTPRTAWPAVGDTVAAGPDLMRGVVVRIVPATSLPYAVVKWASGSTGRHTLTSIRRVEPSPERTSP